MSKVVIKEKGILKIFELPDFIALDNSRKLDLDVANSLLDELPCDLYDVIENKYVFFKSQGKYYIYGLNDYDEKPVELSVQEPDVGNKLKLVCYNEKPYVCELDKKENIIKVYIVLNDCFLFKAMPCTSLQFDLKNDITYLCEKLEDGTKKGIFDTQKQEYISCSYNNHLSFIESLKEEKYYIAERNESEKIITFYYTDRYSGNYQKISTQTTNSFLKNSCYFGDEYIIEELDGRIIGTYNTYRNYKIFASNIVAGKLEFAGGFIYEFDPSSDIINIYYKYDGYNIKTRPDSTFAYNEYIGRGFFIEEEQRDIVSIYLNMNNRVIANQGNYLRYYERKGKLIIKEFTRKGRKVKKYVF